MAFKDHHQKALDRSSCYSNSVMGRPKVNMSCYTTLYRAMLVVNICTSESIFARTTVLKYWFNSWLNSFTHILALSLILINKKNGNKKGR